MYHDRQGVAVVPPTVPGAFLGLPEKGMLRKQKSIGMTTLKCVCVLCKAADWQPLVQILHWHIVFILAARCRNQSDGIYDYVRTAGHDGQFGFSFVKSDLFMTHELCPIFLYTRSHYKDKGEQKATVMWHARGTTLSDANKRRHAAVFTEVDLV